MRSVLCFILALSISVTAAAQVEQATETNTAEPFEARKIWLAMPASLFVGFGMGQAIQQRYGDYGWAFTTADSIGYFFLIMTLGDCAERTGSCQDNKTKMGDSAKAILITSRVAQFADTSIWGYKYYNKFYSTAYFLPQKDGAMLAYNISF